MVFKRDTLKIIYPALVRFWFWNNMIKLEAVVILSLIKVKKPENLFLSHLYHKIIPNMICREHTSSVERFSENFSDKAVTYLIFFIGTH